MEQEKKKASDPIPSFTWFIGAYWVFSIGDYPTRHALAGGAHAARLGGSLVLAALAGGPGSWRRCGMQVARGLRV